MQPEDPSFRALQAEDLVETTSLCACLRPLAIWFPGSPRLGLAGSGKGGVDDVR
jgi:hypothetical protein